jgi:hypothetical protein
VEYVQQAALFQGQVHPLCIALVLDQTIPDTPVRWALVPTCTCFSLTVYPRR